MKPKTVLIAGCNGQAGRTLQALAPSGVQISAYDLDRLDIGNQRHVEEVVAGLGPEVIINAAAYTAVDRAETERDKAYRANAEGPRYLAEAAKKHAAQLVHISTDYVFDGKQSHPYAPGDPVNPLNVYGSSKLAGEHAVREIHPDGALILRTSWLYAPRCANFVTTMLRLMGEREELNVVSDQVGSPTHADGLAKAIWNGVKLRAAGLYHWSDAGVASWYDFAIAIQEEAIEQGILDRGIQIKPIPSSDYRTPAPRPFYSVMDCRDTWKALEIEPTHWRKALRRMIRESRV